MPPQMISSRKSFALLLRILAVLGRTEKHLGFRKYLWMISFVEVAIEIFLVAESIWSAAFNWALEGKSVLYSVAVQLIRMFEAFKACETCICKDMRLLY